MNEIYDSKVYGKNDIFDYDKLPSYYKDFNEINYIKLKYN